MDKKDKVEFNPQEFEDSWQKKWESEKTFSPSLENSKNPYFNLMMFPYPSAEGLHVGNMYAFTGADVYARFNRMQGKDVLEPIGLDGFGIHSENYALKIGKNPKEQAKVSQENYYRQLRAIGNSFDWERTLETYDPLFYRWTQWLFVKLFKSGLAYRKKAEVNFCPSCKTVLSDEQVIPASTDASQGGDGKCERCSSVVEKKELEQWFFKITDYADRLLENIEKLDWTEKVKVAQRNWIGKSEGSVLTFEVVDKSDKIQVFTTRPDTLFGATFLVISPFHPLASKIENAEVKKYIELSRKKSKVDRIVEDKDSSTGSGQGKTGVFSGEYVINPVNSEKLPIWIADYVLMSYGTGAIMAVPAHDQRDFEFAKKYDLEIQEVVESMGDVRGPAASHPHPTFSVADAPSDRSMGAPRSASPLTEAYIGSGKLINSREWDGWEMPKMMQKVVDWLEKNGIGKAESTFHLRDWLISRQRYWGPPIPMIYCENCKSEGKSWFTTKEAEQGIEARSKNQESSKNNYSSFMLHDSASMAGWYPVPEAELPVLLPDVEDWKPRSSPSGGSSMQAAEVKGPLANHPEFYEVKCPSCGSDAKRETDVSDTFLDSAWYFLGYISNLEQRAKSKEQNVSAPWDSEIEQKWLPVAKYIGGAEHSVLHLLYSRFISMVLYDLKPARNAAQSEAGGLTHFEEPFSSFFAHGLIIKNGAKMSKSKGNVVVPDEYIAKYGADTLRAYLMFLGPFSEGGDFRDSGIEGMHRFLRRVWKLFSETQISNYQFPITNELSNERNFQMHNAIKRVTEDIESLKYNTAIAALMEYYNFLSSLKDPISKTEIFTFIKLFAPFAPFMTEELWQGMNHESGIMNQEKITSDKPRNDNFPSIHLSEWPEFDEKYLVSDEVIVVIQINGKRRGEVKISQSELENKEKVESQAREIVSKYLEGGVKKVIFVPGKIINFVI